MKRLFILSCFAIIIAACSTSKQIPISEISGKYYWQITYPHDVWANIQLNPDRTFKYCWRQGMICGTTLGTWELSKNTLVLNSEKQPKKKDKETFNLIMNPLTNKEGLEIKLIDEESKVSLLYAKCLLMNESKLIEETTTDEFGVCMLSKFRQAEKLHIQSLDYGNIEISSIELTGNDYTIELFLNHELNRYEYFTNRKWRIKGNRIYDPKIRPDKYAKKYYVKEGKTER
ncbi:MAG: hypothetical protein R3E32_19770 [Chitinophagales bacterium]